MELIRIGKNTVHNYNNFEKYGTKDADIIRALLLYFSLKYQNDLFGFGTLDPSVFAKEMGFDYKGLLKKHKNPHQFKDLSKKEVEYFYELESKEPLKNHLFDNLFENALYILFRDNLIFQNFYSKKSLMGKKSSLKSVQIITELEILFSSQKGGKKYFYNFKLSEEFLNNISTYFLNTNIKTFVSLRKSNNDGLYLYLSNVLQEMKGSFIEEKYLNFDLLCIKGKINNKVEKSKKYNLTKALNKLKETDLKFSYIYTKKNEQSKWKYNILLTNKNIYSGKQNKKEYNDKIFQEIFKNELNHALLDKFTTLHDYINLKEEFIIWYKKGSKIDKEEKTLAYTSTYFKIHGKVPNYINSIVKSWFTKIDKTENI